MDKDNFIEILRITKAHGVRGILCAVLFSGSMKSYKKIYDASGSEHTFKVIRYTGGNNVLLSISGIEDRNAAESLKGLCFFVKKEDLPGLLEGEFYICDLIGKTLKIVGSEESTGYVISDLFDFGAGNLIEVTCEDDSFLIPFTAENFPNSDSKVDIQVTAEAFNSYKNSD